MESWRITEELDYMKQSYRHCLSCRNPINIFNIETCDICDSEYCKDCFKIHNCLNDD